MNYWPLIGILLILVGFILKFDTTAVVIFSAVVTALCSGMSITKTLTVIGQGFVDNRMVSLYFLTLPMIGLIESHGLREVAVKTITKIKKATPGKILNVYMYLRGLGLLFGIALSGQVTFVRPLVSPMVLASAEAQGKLSPHEREMLKARSAAADNISNFFTQNLFVASSGVLLISATMKSLGHAVSPSQIALYTIPMAVISLLVESIDNLWMDKKRSRNEA